MMAVVDKLHCFTLLRPVTVSFVVFYVTRITKVEEEAATGKYDQIGEHQNLKGGRLIGQHQPHGKTFSN